MIVFLFPPSARLGAISLNLMLMKTCIQYKVDIFVILCFKMSPFGIWCLYMKEFTCFYLLLKLNSTYNKLREKPMFLEFFIECMHMYVYVCMCRGKRRISSVLLCHAAFLPWDWLSHRTWSSLFCVGWLWVPGIHMSVSNAEVIIPVAMINFFCESKHVCMIQDK